jgi:hypothetical protein
VPSGSGKSRSLRCLRAGKLLRACTLSVNTSGRSLKMYAVPSPCKGAHQSGCRPG